MKALFFFFLTLSSLSAMDFGIDRLHLPQYQDLLKDKKLAVLTHAAAKNKDGLHLIDILFKNYQLIKIFAPEHGLRTLEDDWISSGIDPETNLSIISLYQQGQISPKITDLNDIDAVVIDLVDVGVRSYTYFATIGEMMKVCSLANKEIIILDRPNLLGGQRLEGKVLDKNLLAGLTAYHPIPFRHGMTLGELTSLLKAERGDKATLSIIPVSGWFGEELIETFPRTWLLPSPALTTLTQVGAYALWGSLENFNLSVGRGQTNEQAFKIFGAPWITPDEAIDLAKNLNAIGFSSLKFKPFSWMVTRAVFKNEIANGIQIEINEGAFNLRSDEVTYELLLVLHRQFGERLTSHIGALRALGSAQILNDIKSQKPWSSQQLNIDKELKDFRIRRLPFLIYPRLKVHSESILVKKKNHHW
jgi:uncharacterized protein YbbC (DUF1343 family)